MEPITRKEMFLNAIATGDASDLPEPITRIEKYMAFAAGAYNGSLPNPITRKEIYWAHIAKAINKNIPEPITRIEQYLYAICNNSSKDIPEPITREEIYLSKIAQISPEKEGYITENIQLWLDGIENTRSGHNDDSLVWEDLSGNGYDFSGSTVKCFDEDSYANNANTKKVLSCGQAIMESFSEFTIEICLIPLVSPNGSWVFQNRQNSTATGNGFQITIPISTSVTSAQFFAVKNNKTSISASSLNAYIETNDIRTLSFTFSNEIIVGYFNGLKTGENDGANTIRSVLARTNYDIGSAKGWTDANYSFNGRIYSIRIYDRALTDDEIAQNFAEDKKRFFKDDILKVLVPKDVMVVDNLKYLGYTNLQSVTFEGTPTSISAGAFSNCENLIVINVPWSEGKVANAPWGATNATINYDYVPKEKENDN